MVKTTENDDANSSFDILRVRQLKLDSLDSLSSTSVSLKTDLLPYQDNTYSIGNDTFRVQKVYNVRNYVPVDDAGTTFQSTSNIKLNAGVSTPIPLTISSAVYDVAPPNAYNFKLPHRGFYIMTFNILYDTGATSNLVKVSLFNSTYSEFQQFYKFNSNSLQTSMVSLSFWCNDAFEEYSLFGESETNNVTNFRITFGRLMCASSFE